jgi:hypothetical protein
MMILILAAAYAQSIYWFCLRDTTEQYAQTTWDACLLR